MSVSQPIPDEGQGQIFLFHISGCQRRRLHLISFFVVTFMLIFKGKIAFKIYVCMYVI